MNTESNFPHPQMNDPKLGSTAGIANQPRDPKAHDMLHAIQSLEYVVTRLCRMRQVIESGDMPVETDACDPAPFNATVGALLSEGPSHIKATQGRMLQCIDDIENLLF